MMKEDTRQPTEYNVCVNSENPSLSHTKSNWGKKTKRKEKVYSNHKTIYNELSKPYINIGVNLSQKLRKVRFCVDMIKTSNMKMEEKICIVIKAPTPKKKSCDKNTNKI